MVKPLVILVHGTRATKHVWDGYDALLPDAEVLAVDLPGHGDRHATRCTRDNVFATLDAAVAEATRDQPVILVGHSLGGYFCALYAQHCRLQGRDELGALILVGTTADPASRIALLYKGFAKLLPVVGFERMTTIANAMYRLLGERGELPGAESYAALSDAWQIVFDECGPATLRGLTYPVVLVNGQFDQMRIHASRFAQQTGGTSRYIVHGASHLLPETHPAQLACIITNAARTLGSRGQTTR